MSSATQQTGVAATQVTDQAAKPEHKSLWCNFCGFESDDLNAYLAHSCVTVLEQQGQTVAPTGQNECR